MERVMFATAFGPGREWCGPLVGDVLRKLEGVTDLCIALDGCGQGVASQLRCASYGSSYETRTTDHGPRSTIHGPRFRTRRWLVLPTWDGGEDPRRYQRLARMRTALREAFLASGCDWLYFHDSDMLPPMDIVPRLMSLGAPICTGCYPLRGLEHGMQPILHCRGEETSARLQHCDGYGMGCMLIHREVLERVAFRTPEYWRDVDPEGVGEDWQWGLDAAEAGYETLVDTSLSCWHCSEDGRAARLVFAEERDYCCVWMGDGTVTNEFGTWRHGSVRTDMEPADCAALPAGFVHSWERAQWLEWAEIDRG